MRSSITSLIYFGAASLATAKSGSNRAKCSSVFPSSSSSVHPSSNSTVILSSSSTVLPSATIPPSASLSVYPSSNSSVILSSDSSTSHSSGSVDLSESSTASGSSSISTGASASTTSGLNDTTSFSNSSVTATTVLSITLTSSASVTTSAAVQIVVNDVGNGNFASYDESSPGGIANWESQNCEINLQYGYQGDGSSDTGCVQMIAAPTIKVRAVKRDDYNAMIEQYLQNVDETSHYTIRFYYTVLSNNLADTCRMEAYYGDALVANSAYFDVVTDAVAGNTPWVELVEEVPLSSAEGYMRFQLTCTGGGSAVVFIDEVFVSNKVDASSVDDISLLYTSTVPATSSVSTSTSITSTTASTTSSVISSDSTADTISSTTSSAVSSDYTIDPSSTTSSAVSSDYSADLSSTTSSADATSSSSISISSYSTESSVSVSVPSSSPASAATTTATSTEQSVVATPTLCVASAAATATSGLTCGRYIYSNIGSYKQILVSDVTRDQCAAACLADSNCQSISYYSSVSCSATCLLQSSSVAGMGYNYQGGNGFPQVWDKGCFTETTCAAPAADSVCLDKAGSAPASTCQGGFMGKAKSCATPFATATVSGLCGAGACMALCKQYPSCKSYSTTYGGSVTCNFYSKELNEVAESASGATIFADISCYQCGSGSSVYNWLTPLADPVWMPDMSACTAVSSASIVSSTSTSSSIVATITSASSTSITPSTTVTPTTSSTSSSSTSCITCTAVTGALSGPTCVVQGDFKYQEAYGVASGNQNSIMDCAAICDQDESCEAYGYRANSNPYYGCAFIQTSLQDAGFYSSTSANYYWSDKNCASCSDSCLSPTFALVDSSSSDTLDSDMTSEYASYQSTTMSTSTIIVGYTQTTGTHSRMSVYTEITATSSSEATADSDDSTTYAPEISIYTETTTSAYAKPTYTSA